MNDELELEESIYCQAWTVDGFQSFTWDQWQAFDYNKIQEKDGPNIIYSDGTKVWVSNSIPHRWDGPAIIYTDGSCTWYINGNQLDLDTNQIEDWAKENNLDLSTPEGQTAFKLRWL